MNKREREDIKILKNIFKNANAKKSLCVLCQNEASNSHLLQKNGILNLISFNNHIVQVKATDFFAIEEKGIIDISPIGINNAMSYPIFCNEHDTSIFAPIEKEKLDLNLYRNQLLFCYRALCAEIWKKKLGIDIYQRVLNSSRFAFHKGFREIASEIVDGNSVSLGDVSWYKNEFETDLNIDDKQTFEFKKFEFDFIPVCASAVYSPIDPKIQTRQVLKEHPTILNYLFINLIPQHNSTILILGYHKSKFNDWMNNYISSWNNLNKAELEIKLTDLFATKIETWSISPEYFSKLNSKRIAEFKNYWNQNASNLRITQEVNFNLFEL